ncbi:MAG: peptide chain release factor N(5)-glutamine methyltransferase [Actinobacteria bacterium]|nr:peptide chain release factor N(5)-glutamine methyltransferase [Actinomycetota bacterium]
MARREAGEPLQYVVSRWGFRTLDLYVDRRVLIPRPETEIVAGAVIDLDPRGVVVDLGTGSGAIALSVAVETKAARIIATDASADALAVARANLAGLGHRATRVELYEGDWFAAVPADVRGGVDVIVSNPPYIAAHEDLPGEVADWEPTTALVAGATGLEAIERIAGEAPEWLRPGGTLVVEIAPHQRDAALRLCTRYLHAEVRKDLTERDRVLVATR